MSECVSVFREEVFCELFEYVFVFGLVCWLDVFDELGLYGLYGFCESEF